MGALLQRVRPFAPAGVALGASIVLLGLGESSYPAIVLGFVLAASALVLTTSPE
ncbi:MAG: hypothetical protein KDA24_17020 [Deltaproteobacteria bacterium]|nr:hypothetical protein [Deltaproteobacteria bacterium]